MTWHSRTCSSLSAEPILSPARGILSRAREQAVLLFLLTLPLHAATVTGAITLSDTKSRNYSGVVVWLQPTGPARALPSGNARSKMDQRDKTFLPHVLAIQTGTLVDFPNSDPIFHNAFSNYNGKTFDIGLYPPGTTRTVRFTGPGVVRVFCNIHAAMSAVIVVVDTPHFATSKKDGTFHIENVPPGEYTLRVFHERATETTLDRLTRRVTVAGDLTLPPLSISESGFIAIPHSNKYGRDYQPEPSGGALYPAHH